METESGCSGGEGGELDAVVSACVLGGFSEASETRALLSSLPDVHGDMMASESTTERFLGETDTRRALKQTVFTQCFWMFSGFMLFLLLPQ